MPVFGSLGNLNNGSRDELYGRFAPFLIPAPSGHANKDLHLLVVNMPIVPATGLEGHYLMRKAKSMLLDGRSVSEVSEALGFEYPQNLTRMFKKEFGVAPSKIVKI